MAKVGQGLWRFSGGHLSPGASTVLQIKLSLVCLQRLLNDYLVHTSKYTHCYSMFVCLMTSTTAGQRCEMHQEETTATDVHRIILFAAMHLMVY